MAATSESQARTRAFARVIGPFLVIVPSIVAMRVPELSSGAFLSSFFQHDVIVWMTGAMLLIGGLIIIARHQYWWSLAAVLISLFGWFLALRGIVLLAARQWIARGANAVIGDTLVVQLGFGVLVLIGLYLTFVGWITQPSPRE